MISLCKEARVPTNTAGLISRLERPGHPTGLTAAFQQLLQDLPGGALSLHHALAVSCELSVHAYVCLTSARAWEVGVYSSAAEPFSADHPQTFTCLRESLQS